MVKGPNLMLKIILLSVLAFGVTMLFIRKVPRLRFFVDIAKPNSGDKLVQRIMATGAFGDIRRVVKCSTRA